MLDNLPLGTLVWRDRKSWAPSWRCEGALEICTPWSRWTESWNKVFASFEWSKFAHLLEQELRSWLQHWTQKPESVPSEKEPKMFVILLLKIFLLFKWKELMKIELVKNNFNLSLKTLLIVCHSFKSKVFSMPIRFYVLQCTYF